MKYTKFYNWLFDYHWLIIFFLFLFPLFIVGITQNEIYLIIGWSILLAFMLFCILYLYCSFKDIKYWYYRKIKYKLSPSEKIIWESIEKKAKIGYDEWFAKTKGDDLCGPWIKDYTKEENDLIDKIHHQLYGKDWWIAMPIHTAQVNYVMYEDIKDRIIWKDQ